MSRQEGWIKACKKKRFFPWCVAIEETRCDVDENLWPLKKKEDRVVVYLYMCVYGKSVRHITDLAQKNKAH